MNNSEEAERKLGSETVEERLQAARYFSSHATARHYPLLVNAASKENVPWIKRALDQAILRAKHSSSASVNAQGTDEDATHDVAEAIVRDLQLKAVEEVAGTVLHEFSALVGSLRLRAPQEVGNYEESHTKKLLDQLSNLIDAVRNLKKSAAVPIISEFDLAELVDSSMATSDVPDALSISTAGSRPFLINGDRNSMQLALVNGFRNAIEAITESSRILPPRIVINWGRAGAENYLVIVDSGPGFVGDPAAALRLGVTNKQMQGHIGYGLAIAQYAMRSMDGEIRVSNDDAGGARFEMRWYVSHENFIG